MRKMTFVALAATSLLSNAQEWQLLTPIKSTSRFVALEMITTDVGYAVDGMMNAVLRTSNGGDDWVRMQNDLSYAPSALHMWNISEGLIVCGTGRIIRSSDGFRTFTSSFQSGAGNLSAVHFLDGLHGLIGSESGKILRTLDGGSTWDPVHSSSVDEDVITAVQFVTAEVAYASASISGILKSVDGGSTWQPTASIGNAIIRDIHFSDASTGIGVGYSPGTRIVRTTDGGTTWSDMIEVFAGHLHDITVQGDIMLASSQQGTIVRSTDGGLTWTSLEVGGPNRSITLLPNGQGLLGSDGYMHRTMDFGASWERIHKGTPVFQIRHASFADEQRGAMVGYSPMTSGMLRTSDGGRTWAVGEVGGGYAVHMRPDGIGSRGSVGGNFGRTNNFFETAAFVPPGPNVTIRSCWSLSASTHIMAGTSLYRTVNGGLDWTTTLTGSSPIFDLHFVNSLLGHAVGADGTALKTIDGGITWTSMDTGLDGWPLVSVEFLDEQHGWIATGNGLKTSNGGETWTEMAPELYGVNWIHFTHLDTGYAVLFTGATWMTVDAGATWTNVLPEIPQLTIGDAALVDGAIIIGSVNGDIFRAPIACTASPTASTITANGNTLCTSTSGTAQWYLNGEPLEQVTTLCMQPQVDGVYQVTVTDLNGCSSGLSEPFIVAWTHVEQVMVQAPVRLLPNPTNGPIRIERPEEDRTPVRLMDLQGRIIRTGMMVGRTAFWDVSDLPCGVYIVRIGPDGDATTLRLLKD
ncbi:MAG TPA: YCF48-related protein [Flavobacteriales bacterium]